MQEIAQAAVAAHSEEGADAVVGAVIAGLRERYPEHVANDEQPEWLFNNAGGAMGAMTVLHSSLSEYVIIFGTAVGTEGHTGRFLADDYFTILDGEQWAFAPGSLTKVSCATRNVSIERRREELHAHARAIGTRLRGARSRGQAL